MSHDHRSEQDNARAADSVAQNSDEESASANASASARSQRAAAADIRSQLSPGAGYLGAPATAGTANGQQLAAAARAAADALRAVNGPRLALFADARDTLSPDIAQRAADILDSIANAVDVRDQINAYVAAGATTSAQGADLGQLPPLAGNLAVLIAVAEQRAADELGPHRFGGRAVMPGAVAPPMSSDARIELGRISAEAGHTVELVAIAARLRDRWIAAAGVLTPALEQDIAEIFAPLASRPVHFAFVKAALSDIEIWAYLEKAKAGAKPHAKPDTIAGMVAEGMAPDRSLGNVDQDAQRQGQQFGAMVELHDFDQAAAIGILESNTTISYQNTEHSAVSRSAGTANATRVLDMMKDLDPAARAAVLEHFRKANVLDLFAGGLPFGAVEQLHDTLPRGFGDVGQELRKYFQQRDRTDYTVGALLDRIPGVGHQVESVANFATFGFLHEHDHALRQSQRGVTTEDEYAHSTIKAAERATAVAVVSTATGGAAGSLAENATAQIAERGIAGRIASTTITGAAAGGAGNLGARAGSDIVDGEISSIGDYVHDGLVGMAAGGVIGGAVGTAVEVAPHVRAKLSSIVERFKLPPSGTVATAIQSAATSGGAVVRFVAKVAELLDAARSGAIRINAELRATLEHGVGPRPAYAGAYETSQLDRFTVDAVAEPSLQLPGQLADGPAITVLHAERLRDDIGQDLASHLGESPETTGGMHIFDGAQDAERMQQATAAATRSNIGSRTALAEHIPPPGPEFVQWFDSLTLSELDRLLADRGSPGVRGAVSVIEDNIRHPGGLHEWLMVKHARKVKEWGVSLQTVLDARSATDTTVGRSFHHKRPDGTPGAGPGSGNMHRDLSRMINESPTFDAFRHKLNSWADRELYPVAGPRGEPARGRYYLPRELQMTAEDGGHAL